MKRRILAVLLVLVMTIMSASSLAFAAMPAEDEAGHNHVDGYCRICGQGDVSLAQVNDYVPQEPVEGEEIVPTTAETAVADVDGVYYDSLDQALYEAQPGSTVTLLTTTAVAHKLVIDKDMTIAGTEALVRDFGSDAMIEVVAGANVRFENIILDGNNAYYSGYSLLNILDGATVTLSGVTFQNSTANYGAAVYVDESSRLYAEGSIFASCAANYAGGAIYNAGTATVSDTEALVSAFTDNTAAYGGAIKNVGTLELYGGNFVNNSATVNGGAVSNDAAMMIAGNVIASVNTVNGMTDNIYIADTGSITLNGDLTGIAGINSYAYQNGEVFGDYTEFASGANNLFCDTDTVLYAEQVNGVLAWTDGTVVYTVSFDTNGAGEGPVDQSVVGGEYAQKPVPSDDFYPGYTFDGWFLEPECINQFSFESQPVTENLVLYAKWTPVQEDTVEPEDNLLDNDLLPDEEIIPDDEIVPDDILSDDEIRPEDENILNNDAMPEENSQGIVPFEETDNTADNLADLSDDGDNEEEDLGLGQETPDNTEEEMEGTPSEPMPLLRNTNAANTANLLGAPPAANNVDADLQGADLDLATIHTISFDVMDPGRAASIAIDSVQVQEGATLTAPEELTEGQVITVGDVEYSFKRWFTDQQDPETGEWIPYDFSTPVSSDFTLYAGWHQILSYQVSYDMQGHGEQVESEIVPDNKLVTEPQPPTEEGYVFQGWFTEPECTNPFDFENTYLSNDITLYAYWVEQAEATFTVTFYGKDGVVADTKQVKNGETVERPQVPAIQGWECIDWYADEACTTVFDFTEPITQDTEIFSLWKQLFTVTYHYNGHGYDDEVYALLDGSVEEKPEDPTDEGFTFDGWFDNEDNKIEFPVTITADTDFYAKWTEDITAHTVTFDMCGHGKAIEAQNVEDGGHATKPQDPTEENWTFLGWYDNQEYSGEPFDFAKTVISEDITLYANWEEVQPEVEKHSLTFHLNGHGDDSQAYAIQYKEVGEFFTRPSDPTASAWKFIDWYTTDRFETTVDFNAPVTADVDAWARWEPVSANMYTVVFEANGHGDAETMPKDQIVEEGKQAVKPAADPTASDGYAFTNWYANKECTTLFDFTRPIKADTVVYAGWEVVPHKTNTVTFDVQGKTLVNPIKMSYTVLTGTSLESTEGFVIPMPKSDGFLFGGWFTDKECTNAYIMSTIVSEDITLYAKWTPVSAESYVISFDPNGHGITSITQQAVKDGGKVTAPVMPNAPGYTFLGWFKDQAGTTEYDFAAEVHESFTLYAKWEANEYRIEFNANNGTGNMNPLTCKYGEKYNLPTMGFTRSGYTFVGWNTSPAGQGTAYADGAEVLNLTTTKNGVVTLYAQWKSLYDVVEGGGSQFVKGSDKALTFRVNADYAKFVGIKVDGVSVPAANYDSWAGTYVSLKAAYLETLTTGEHTLTFVFTDSEVSVKFIVTTASYVKTGDTNNATLWIIIGGIAVVACGVAIAVILIKRQKRR